MDWREGEPVPRPFVGAVVLHKPYWGDEPFVPAMIVAIQDNDPFSVDLVVWEHSMTMPFSNVPVQREEDTTEQPCWKWPNSVLNVYRRVRELEKLLPAPKSKLVKRKIKL